MRRPLAPFLLTAGLGLMLSSCAQPAAPAGPEGGGAGAIPVVTSTNVYGDIVRQIGGDAVEVTAVIDRLSQDPHSYEATAQDKLLVTKAALLVQNGGGYDDFLHTLADDAGSDTAAVLTAVDVAGLEDEEHAGESAEERAGEGAEAHAGEGAEAHAEESGHDHGAFNEHVWYDLDSMEKLADAVAAELGRIRPADAATFTANAEQFGTGLQKLQDELEAVRAGNEGATFAQTEPVPAYLLEDAGLTDATPEGFSAAIEAETDVPPLVLKEMGELLASGGVELLAYNDQTEGPQTRAVREQAEAAGVPVLNFTETLPDGEDYLGWMAANIEALKAAAGE